MSNQNPNIMQPGKINSPLGSAVQSGVNASGGWGGALSSLAQLPGALVHQFGAANQASNAANAAAGNSYTNSSGMPVVNQQALGLRAASPTSNLSNASPALSPAQTQKPQIQDPATLRAQGKMQDPVTGQIFPIPGYTPPSTTGGSSTPPPNGGYNPGATGPSVNGNPPAPQTYGSGTTSQPSQAYPQGQQAPPGMEYGPNGQLQSQGTGTQTGTNTLGNPYTVNNGLYGQLLVGLANKANQPSQDYLNQEAQANQYNQALTTSRQNEAGQLALNASNPIPLEFQQGRAQVLQSQYAQEQAALGAGYQGAASLLGAANTQQGLQQGGLGAAAAGAAPQQVSPTNVPFNPATGQYGNPAYNAYGAGGLQTVGNIGAQIGVGQNIGGLNSQLGGAQVEGQSLQKLITDNGINPYDPNLLNAINNFIQTGVMSNPQYNKFNGQVNSFIQSMAPILGSGGSATDFKTQLSQAIVNAQSSGQSMNDVIGYFLDLAKQKLQGMSAGGGVGVGGGTQTNNQGFTKFYGGQ